MNDFLKILLGEMDLPVFMAYFTIAMLGALFVMMHRANKKRKTSLDTPDHFSWLFFLQDNIRRLIILILSIVFCIRFSNEIIGQEITGYVSLFIGLGNNWISAKLTKLEEKSRS